MILTLIGLGTVAAAGYAYYQHNKPALTKANAAAARIEKTVAAESAKIEAAVKSEVATAEAMVKAAQSRVSALLNSGHVDGTAIVTTLTNTETTLVEAANRITGASTHYAQA